MRQVAYLTLTLATMMIVGALHAQNLQTPAPSPAAKVEQTVGINTFTISYARPGVKGRELFVEVESWGNMWRTGANAGTFLEFDGTADFGGTSVEAGRYMVLSIPGQEEWTWMLYTDTSIGGNLSLYDESKVAAKWTSKTNTWDQNVERLTFTFNNVTDNSAEIAMYWGKYATSFKVTVDTDTQVMAQIGEVMENPMARVGGLHAQAATYYLQNDKDLDKALEWMTKAIEINPNAFWNIHTKAQILAKMGKKKEAIETANKSKDMAKNNPGGDFGYVKRNDDLIASIK